MRDPIDRLGDHIVELWQSPAFHRRAHAFIAGFLMATLYALLSASRS